MIDNPGGAPVTAIIDGVCIGRRLTFTKYPDDLGMAGAIDYDGEVSADGQSISGSWTIPGDWSGVFQMQRRLTHGPLEADLVEDVRA